MGYPAVLERSAPSLQRVSRTVTYVIELGVGLGCIVAAAPLVGRRPLRWLGVVVLVAGVTAVVHASIRLSG